MRGLSLSLSLLSSLIYIFFVFLFLSPLLSILHVYTGQGAIYVYYILLSSRLKSFLSFTTHPLFKNSTRSVILIRSGVLCILVSTYVVLCLVLRDLTDVHMHVPIRVKLFFVVSTIHFFIRPFDDILLKIFPYDLVNTESTQ
jgi:hypothetical protein